LGADAFLWGSGPHVCPAEALDTGDAFEHGELQIALAGVLGRAA
jgi:hypothetical protein